MNVFCQLSTQLLFTWLSYYVKRLRILTLVNTIMDGKSNGIKR